MDAIRIAAQKTLELVRTGYGCVVPRKWQGYEGDRGFGPGNTHAQIADALWELEQIPTLLDEGGRDAAFYALGAAQTLLWIAQVASRHELEQINRDALAATACMA